MTSATHEETPKKIREGPQITLATQVLLALALGAATGLFFGEIVAPLEVVGVAFIRLLQITVIPYIVVALITGLGRLDYDEVKRLAVKGGSILLLLWATGITLVLMLPLAFPEIKGSGLVLSYFLALSTVGMGGAYSLHSPGAWIAASGATLQRQTPISSAHGSLQAK